MKRVLLKLSGESLKGKESFGIDQDACLHLAKSIERAKSTGLELAIVIGGGNIFRGIHLKDLGLERTPADHMGMLATLINGTALQQALNKIGISAKVMTALECPSVAETYNWHKANDYLSKGDVVIFVGGTGNPYFTTDTAAALRASEIGADTLLKATKVPGVYNKDPKKFPDAKKYDTLSYSQYLNEKLEVMDATAISLCMSNQIPIFVFDMQQLSSNTLEEIVSKKELGTAIKESLIKGEKMP